jgi:hypothetical protein
VCGVACRAQDVTKELYECYDRFPVQFRFYVPQVACNALPCDRTAIQCMSYAVLRDSGGWACRLSRSCVRNRGVTHQAATVSVWVCTLPTCRVVMLCAAHQLSASRQEPQQRCLGGVSAGQVRAVRCLPRRPVRPACREVCCGAHHRRCEAYRPDAHHAAAMESPPVAVVRVVRHCSLPLCVAGPCCSHTVSTGS